MRIRRGLIWIFGFVVVLGGLQYALQYYGSRMLARNLAQTRDWADIRVGSARFWLWGVVNLDRIRVAPAASLRARYALSPDYVIGIASLRIHQFRFGWDHGPVLTSLRMTARRARLPVPDWRWAITVARSPSGNRRSAPTLRSMGISPMPFDADIVLRFMEGYSLPRLNLRVEGPGLARIHLRCSLERPPGTNVAREPAGLEIRGCRLDYRDLGLLTRFETRMAAKNGIPLAELQGEISEQIARDAARSHWPPLSTRAVQSFISDPRQILRLRLRPEKPIPLDDVFRGVWSGLPAYLGLTAELVSPSGGSS